LLFAPKSGEETRTLIKTKAGESGDFLKQRSAEIKQNAASLVEKSKDAVVRQKDSLADAVEAGRQAYRDSVNQSSAPASEGQA
jgi:gas vesicle protein